MYKEMSFEELVEHIKNLPFNETISIAEDAEEKERWWSMTRISIADSNALYMNYYGGGSPHIVSMEEEDIKEGYFEKHLSSILRNVLELDINEPLLIDDEKEEKETDKKQKINHDFDRE